MIPKWQGLLMVSKWKPLQSSQSFDNSQSITSAMIIDKTDGYFLESSQYSSEMTQHARIKNVKMSP